MFHTYNGMNITWTCKSYVSNIVPSHRRLLSQLSMRKQEELNKEECNRSIEAWHMKKLRTHQNSYIKTKATPHIKNRWRILQTLKTWPGDNHQTESRTLLTEASFIPAAENWPNGATSLQQRATYTTSHPPELPVNTAHSGKEPGQTPAPHYRRRSTEMLKTWNRLPGFVRERERERGWCRCLQRTTKKKTLTKLARWCPFSWSELIRKEIRI